MCFMTTNRCIYYVLLCYMLASTLHICAGAPINILDKLVTDEKAQAYLNQFGYIEKIPLPRNHDERSSAELENVRKAQFSLALKKFQQFSGIQITGILDDRTKEYMNKRRCGVSDLERLARGAYEYKWNKTRITWTIDRYTADLSVSDTRRAFREAFQVWSDVTPLEFVEVQPNTNEKIDMHIIFEAGHHGDAWAFDGQNGVLAHAMYPEDGRAHFDDDENWIYRDPKKAADYDYADVLAVAIHELGHALGLSHSKNDDAIMAAFYKMAPAMQDVYIMPRLHKDDIRRIQKLYGDRNTKPSITKATTTDVPDTTTPTTTSVPDTTTPIATVTAKVAVRRGQLPDIALTFPVTQRTTRRPSTPRPRTTAETVATTTLRTRRRPVTPPVISPRLPKIEEGDADYPSDGSSHCAADIDALTKAMNGRTYVFMGDTVWELHGNTLRNRRRLAEFFPEGPTSVTAAFTNPRTWFTVIFQGRQLWAYLWNEKTDEFELHPDFPKQLSELIPFVPKAAFQWSDGNTVLLNGEDFATFDENWNVPTMVQRTETYFPNLPATSQATVSLYDKDTLLIVDQQVYYLYDMAAQVVVQDYPKPLTSFLRC